MTLAELNNVLVSTGFPVAYGFFPEDDKTEPPCITYQEAYSSNFGADEKVYKKIKHIDIFLFTRTKDIDAEAKVEQALDDASIFYETTETFEESEQVYQILYEVTIYG